ncbi:MAG: hypothetical protein JRI92_03355, partial [Deltaproteobacteria bacterium]|nr:hypothetical protein [Deltaproteobacteria bacterium]
MTTDEEEDIEDTLVSIDGDFYDEIHGFAQSCGISDEQAIFILGLLDKYLPMGECTTSTSTGLATQYYGDRDTLLSQNLDGQGPIVALYRFFSHFPLISKIGSGYKFAHIGIPLFSQFPIINEKGLGLGGNGISLNQDYNNSQIDSRRLGKSSYGLYRKSAMECDTVQDVADLWENAVRAAGFGARENGKGKRLWPHHYDNMVSMWCDANGDILAIEQMANYFVAAYRDSTEITGTDFEDILWHANHHQWNAEWDTAHPDSITGSKTPIQYPSSGKRADWMKELLEYYYSFITEQKYINLITADHTGGHDPYAEDSWDICRHQDNNQDLFTMIGWIVSPEDKTVWISPTYPCEEQWIEHDYESEFSSVSSEDQLVSKSYSTYPIGYYFQLGTMPYLLQTLKDSGYIAEDLDDDEKTNLIILAVIADFMAMSDNLQFSHNFAVTRADKYFDQTDELYLNCSTFPSTIVNAGISGDDPVNNTWTTIQKAIDNTTNLGIIIVNNGTYSEDIVIDKSIILFGEDKNNVTINGSITMINPHDYELISYGEDDIIQNVNMTGLELLFHFNNDTRVGENYSNSSVVFDYSGLQNNGTNNNATLITSTIKGSGAFMFNGINNSINLSSIIPALNTSIVTISSWVNWQGGSGTIDPIVSQSESPNGYMLYVNSVSDKPAFRLNETEIVSTVSIDNGWHNIVGTHDEKDLKLYVDGVFRGNVSITSTGVDVECFIGYDKVSSYFNGTIDEIAIWNRTLSDTEISHIYDQHYGVTMDGFTVQNSNDVGISLVNHTDLTNFIIKNHTTGVEIDNVFDVRVSANFSDCTSSVEIKDCSLDEFNKIHLVDCNFEDMSNGVFINSSEYVGVYRNYMDCTDIPMQINNCDISTINVVSSTSKDNVAPDTPVLSGGLVGERNTTYIYSAITNDTDDDQLWYYFDWDDGNNTGWLGPYLSNEWVNQTHSFIEEGGYYIRVKTKDVFFNETDWDTILFRTETLPPLINSVNHTPDVVGFGWNVTLMVNATDDESGNASGIQSVSVNITYPDDSYLNESLDSLGNNTYEYVFSDTWLVGQYNYTIWVLDNAYNSNESSGYSFNVSVEANISVCTIKDEYGASEDINITDPPVNNPTNSDVGYELLDDGDVLHIWNKYDSYYFNTSSGIQLTNHYNEYWSHNMLMLGYYNNNQWNLIYRTDELIGFN